LKETVPKVDGRKEFGKSADSAFDRGTGHHPCTIGIGWTRVRVENEDGSAPELYFQAGYDFRRVNDNGDPG